MTLRLGVCGECNGSREHDCRNACEKSQSHGMLQLAPEMEGPSGPQ
jgi:hypothetical protein